MNVIEWMLVSGGEVVRSACSAVATAGVWVGSVVARLVDPLLGPLVAWVNRFSTAAADAFYALADRAPPWVGLTVLSAGVGVGALAVLRGVSNQAAIGRARDDIQANLLALKLFKDQLRVTLGAQVHLAGAIARLQWYMLWPLLIMLPPVVVLAAQMQARYQWRPLTVGDASVLRLTWSADPTADVTATCPDGGVAVEAGPVTGVDDVVWRVRAVEPGRHTVQVRVDGHTLDKEILVGPAAGRPSPLRPTTSWTAQLLYPVEAPLPSDSGIASLELTYPERPAGVAGASWWMLTFFVISMLVAIVLRPAFGVRF